MIGLSLKGTIHTSGRLISIEPYDSLPIVVYGLISHRRRSRRGERRNGVQLSDLNIATLFATPLF